jgi:hypothetical protein
LQLAQGFVQSLVGLGELDTTLRDGEHAQPLTGEGFGDRGEAGIGVRAAG